MAIRNGLKGGTDFSNGEVLHDYDLDDTLDAFFMKAYADNTGDSMSGNTAETDLASVTIPSADFNSDSTSVSFLINCSLDFNRQATFKLYVDGVAVKTKTFTYTGSTSAEDSGGNLSWLATGIDLSSTDKIVKVSGTTTGDANSNAEAFGLTVLAINNN